MFINKLDNRNKKILAISALFFTICSVFGAVAFTNNPVSQAFASYVYSCPEGSTLEGTNCITPYTANNNKPTYTCPNGGVLEGTNCVASITNPIDRKSNDCFLGGSSPVTREMQIGFLNADGSETFGRGNEARTTATVCYVPQNFFLLNSQRQSSADYRDMSVSQFPNPAIGSPLDPKNNAPYGCIGGHPMKSYVHLDPSGTVTYFSSQYQKMMSYKDKVICGGYSIRNTELKDGTPNTWGVLRLEFQYIANMIYGGSIPATMSVTPSLPAQLCPQGWQDSGNQNCTKVAINNGYAVDSSVLGDFVCTPAPIIVSATTAKSNCSAPIININGRTILPPKEDTYIGLLNNNNDNASYLGNSDKCVLNNNTLICNNLPIPSNTIPGKKAISVKEGNKTWPETKGSLDVLRYTTIEDLKSNNANLICNDGKDALVNSKVNCAFVIPSYTTLSPTTKMAIGDGSFDTSMCKMTTGQNAVCENVSTGTLVGNQPIKVQIDNTNSDTGKTLKIIANGNGANLSSLVCTPSETMIETTINCKGNISANVKLSEIKANVGTNPAVNCPEGQVINNLKPVECKNIPVGSKNGLLDIFATAKEVSQPTKIGQVAVYKTLNGDDLAKLVITCNNNLAIRVNSLFDCSFPVPDYTKLPENLKLQLGDAEASKVCQMQSTTSRVAICRDLKAPTTAGQYDLNAIINTTKTPIKKLTVVSEVAALSIGGGSNSNTQVIVQPATVRSGGIQALQIMSLLLVSGGIGYAYMKTRNKTSKVTIS
jgi:hypothetical protein